MTRTMILTTTVMMAFAVDFPALAADPTCTNETLTGSYGLQISGFRPAPFINVGSPGFVGQIEQVIGVVIQIFDGKGNFTQVDNVRGSVSGIIPDRPGRGVYTVNPDCTTTQTVSPPGQTPITSKGVAVDGGKEFRQITISPDFVFVSSVGRKM